MKEAKHQIQILLQLATMVSSYRTYDVQVS